ncbi:MAG: hypothetical protein HY551_02465 [Elusimicrobia bacterium]|nr:hypothetical protein [Elusimicrobiota bacterium]
MKRRGSVYWIVLLLAALFFGPIFYLSTARHPEPPSGFGPLDPRQRLMDAPANKSAVSAVPAP